MSSITTQDIKKEFFKSKMGIAGIAILTILILTSLITIIVIPVETFQEWNIRLQRGMKDAHIYSLSCDDEWVWFLTNNGIIFYNWETYNNVQN